MVVNTVTKVPNSIYVVKKGQNSIWLENKYKTKKGAKKARDEMNNGDGGDWHVSRGGAHGKGVSGDHFNEGNSDY